MVPNDEIFAQLERILASSVFQSSPRSQIFLRYCVTRSMAGETAIKETTIGIEAFGRPPGYDPKIDATVRVQAVRVRERLERYYHQFGAGDRIRIQMSKGSYVPVVTATDEIATDVAATDEDEKPGPESPSPVDDRRSSARRWLLLRIPFGVLAGLLLFAPFIYWQPESASGHVAAPGFALLLSLPGKVETPALSPDGKSLAFAWADGKRMPEIYILAAGHSEPRRLRSNEPDQSPGSAVRPAWNPSGSKLAYVRYQGGLAYDVVVHELSTGNETVAGRFPYYSPIISELPTLDWSPDGNLLLASEQPYWNAPIRLSLLDLANGARRTLTSPHLVFPGDSEGKFSPDGSRVAFERGKYAQLYTVSARGETASGATLLGTIGVPKGSLAWSQGGNRILFSSNRNTPRTGMWSVSASGGEIVPHGPANLDATSPAVAARSGRMVFVQERATVNLVEATVGGIDATQRLVVPSSRRDLAASYSPDGREIVFVSDRSGGMDVWIADLATGHCVPATNLHGVGTPGRPMWSHDQKSLVFVVYKGETSILTLWDRATGKSQELLQVSGQILSLPRFSADDRSIMFSSDVDGIQRVWRLQIANPSHPQPLFSDAYLDFEVSDDGRYVYIPELNHGFRILQREISSGEEKVVFQTDESSFRIGNMIIRGRTLYVAFANDLTYQVANLLAIDLARGTVRHLGSFPVSSGAYLTVFSISPNGKKLILSRARWDESEIYGSDQNGRMTDPAPTSLAASSQ